MIGETLAHYTITGKLGEGGMGEVYRAQDGKLGREVAIKVLPEALAGDAERLARFEREARVLASLNHPNIAAIYGIEEADGKPFLVLELVEGDTLMERIAQGPMPVKDALDVAGQIATALEAAHEQGIIHRDLKPANVKLTPGGKVKVLDFGLAKAWDPSPASGSAPLLTASPTLTQQMTEVGVLLGTAGYMSPEQARGKPVDKRSDIWAFGCVLLEMLTGRRTFGGETVTDIIAAVVAREPEWDALPADTPRSVKRLLNRCLEKEADKRLHDIADARIEIEETREAVASGKIETGEGGEGRRVGRERLLLGTAVAMALLALVLGWRAFNQPSVQTKVIRAEIPPPEGLSFRTAPNGPGSVVVSPDGTRLAFAASDSEGEFQLWVRDLDELEARVLQGSQSPRYPFWSYDGKYLAYFDDDKLRKIEANGGPALTIADAANGKGGTWNQDGVVLFAPTHASAIHRVSAAGGESVPVTELDEEAGENSHRHPRFLPDGRHFVYTARLSADVAADDDTGRLYIGSLDGDVKVPLFKSSFQAEIAAGHLWYIVEDTLMAQPFDVESLSTSGDGFPVAEGVLAHGGAAFGYFSVSDSGVLAYHTGAAEGATSSLVWRNREGQEIGALGEEASYFDTVLSPDGSKAAVVIEDAASGGLDIWIFEVERGIKTRFTFNPGDDQSPVWSPDGSRVAYSSSHAGVRSIFVKDVGGAAEEKLLYHHEGEDAYPDAWSPDGQQMVVAVTKGTGNFDIWLLPLQGDPKAIPLIATDFSEVFCSISPDGHWLAYTSEESGQWEIYVTTFPEIGRKWQISSGGGGQPMWRGDGKELYFIDSDGVLFGAEVDGTGETLRIGAIEQLFDTERRPILQQAHSVTADGQKVLVNTLGDSSKITSPPLTLVVDFPVELENR